MNALGVYQDDDVPVGEADGAGSLASLNFNKGFTQTADRELLNLYLPIVVLSQRGKKNVAELESKSNKKFVTLRQRHSAVESEINSLEHHGLNRCLDVGLPGCLRYVGCRFAAIPFPHSVAYASASSVSAPKARLA